MNPFIAEAVGTGMLMLLGNGVVANVLLNQTKGHGFNWLVITAGWGVAVFVAVFCVDEFSGAHINPAVTIGLAAAGEFPWDMAPGYIAAQMTGALLGALVVVIAYWQHYVVTDDPDTVRATFCTSPAIRHPGWNFVTETIGTFVLVFAVLSLSDPRLGNGMQSTPIGLGSLGALPVGLLVFAIGMSLGGPTGYAINPARDLAPRILHALLPLPHKGQSDWGYAAIPVFGPIAGGIAAALVARVLLL